MDNEKQIREMLDACRPGSSDLELPEFARLKRAIEEDPQQKQVWERSQAFDAAIGEQLRNVEVPDQLADRLLMAVGSDTDEGQVSLVRRSQTKRIWQVAAVALALTIVFVVGSPLVIGPAAESIPTAGEIRHRAIDWPDELTATWLPLASAPTAGPEVGEIRPANWQEVRLPNGDVVVCFNYDVEWGMMHVFAMPAGSVKVAATSPMRASFATQGRHVRVWGTPQAVYVMVMSDSVDADFRQWLRRARSQAA